MKIIQVHNYYQQAGGEDSVVMAERALLEQRGHVVIPYYKNNEALGTGLWALITASLQTLWNGTTYREFKGILQSEKPDVVHCHNTFPLISPALYWACAKEKVPVVQTLHNYRLLCLNAFLFRQYRSEKSGPQRKVSVCSEPDSRTPDIHCTTPAATGSICERCVNKAFKWPGVKYRCYRESLAGSLVVALMLLIHKLINTWSKKVTAYITLTEFQQKKMIEGGLPANKLFVKPNFIQRPEEEISTQTPSATTQLQPESSPNYALFVGRLSPEKGCEVLIRAWRLLEQQRTSRQSSHPATNQHPHLIIVGDGPDRALLESLAFHPTTTYPRNSPQTIHFIGKKLKHEVLHLMQNAQFLVSPSVCYETFGLVVLEAGLQNTPALVCRSGAVAALINDGETGALFAMGDSDDLVEKLQWAFDHPDEIRRMGEKARCVFEQQYSAEVNYHRLIDIYQSARHDAQK